jgi:hypothetical protein
MRDRYFMTDASVQTSLGLLIAVAPLCPPAEAVEVLRTRTVLRGALSAWFNAWLKDVIRHLAVFDPPCLADFDDRVSPSTPADYIDMIVTNRRVDATEADQQTGR